MLLIDKVHINEENILYLKRKYPPHTFFFSIVDAFQTISWLTYTIFQGKAQTLFISFKIWLSIKLWFKECTKPQTMHDWQIE